MIDNVNLNVKLLYRETNGTVTISSLAACLKRRGYDIVFFHTEEGDEILKAYGILPNKTRAFTVCGPLKIVFVDNNLHASDKLYSILHECGHIMLGHLESNGYMLDKRKNENEAEAFAYGALNYKVRLWDKLSNCVQAPIRRRNFLREANLIRF